MKVNTDVPAVFTSAFANQALLDVVEIGLGRKTVPIRKTRPKLRKVVDQDTGKEEWEEETNDVTGEPIMEEYFEPATMLNLPAANQAAHLLARRAKPPSLRRR